MLLERLDVSTDELAARTGWELKPEGACLGDVCVPLGDDVGRPDGRVDATALAGRLGMPLLHDDTHGLWALGPATVTGRALSTAVAPDLSLPDRDGNLFDVASLRGQKVLLVAWASW